MPPPYRHGTECCGADILTTTHQAPSWYTCVRCSAPVYVSGRFYPLRDMTDQGLMDALRRAWDYGGPSEFRPILIDDLLAEASRRIRLKYPGVFE